MIKQLVKSVFLFVLFFDCAYAITLGSNAAVTRQAQPIFPAIDTDNILLGFGAFENGFILEDRTTTCSHNAYFPVSGTVGLGGGTLILQKDLVFENLLDFNNGGKIVGNSFSVELPKSLNDTTILSHELGLDPVYVTSNGASLAGRIRTVDWKSGNNYIAAGTDQSGVSELALFYFDGHKLTTTITVEENEDVFSVQWNPIYTNYLAVGKSFGGASEVEVYRHTVSNGSFTLTGTAGFAGAANAVAWHSSGAYLVAGTDLNATELLVYAFNSVNGVISQIGSIDISPNRDVNPRCLSFSPGGNLLAVGLTNNATVGVNELLVYSFSGGTLTLNSSIDVGTGILALDWSPTGSFIAVGLTSVTGSLRVYRHDAAASSLALVASPSAVAIEINNISWNPTGDFMAVGFEAISGSELKIYSFDTTSFNLAEQSEMPVPNTNDHYGNSWTDDGTYLASGGRNGDLSVYRFAYDSRLLFVDTVLVFNSNVNFTVPVQFQGNCRIDGRGHRLNFLNTGGLVLRPGANVIIQDLLVPCLTQGRMRCMTDRGGITLRNSLLSLATDYTFSRGALLFDKDVIITGSNKFIYSSALSSTIASQSMLLFDQGTTFSYNPRVGKQNLLFMTDATSLLYLNGCTLHSTRTGLQLSGGSLIFDNKVTLSSEARFHAEGMNLKSDLGISVLSGANAQLFGIIRTD
jgi:hypothetical protein